MVQENILKGPGDDQMINVPVGKIVEADGVPKGSQKGKQDKSKGQVADGMLLVFFFIGSEISQPCEKGNGNVIDSHSSTPFFVYGRIILIVTVQPLS